MEVEDLNNGLALPNSSSHAHLRLNRRAIWAVAAVIVVLAVWATLPYTVPLTPWFQNDVGKWKHQLLDRESDLVTDVRVTDHARRVGVLVVGSWKWDHVAIAEKRRLLQVIRRDFSAVSARWGIPIDHLSIVMYAGWWNSLPVAESDPQETRVHMHGPVTTWRTEK
jgi:hypothetical protein